MLLGGRAHDDDDDDDDDDVDGLGCDVFVLFLFFESALLACLCPHIFLLDSAECMAGNGCVALGSARGRENLQVVEAGWSRLWMLRGELVHHQCPDAAVASSSCDSSDSLAEGRP